MRVVLEWAASIRMEGKMQASVYRGPGKIGLEPRGAPRPGPTDLVIQVRACGLCGTDMHILEGEFPAAPGIVLGHEFAGVVTEFGAAVTAFKPGDHVAVDPNIACGLCPACQRGDVHLCDDLQALGVTRDGGFAEMAVLPASQAYRVPEQLSLEACALAEPLSCCLHGLDQAGIRTGDRVLVIGAGPIGLLMVQLARGSGAAVVGVTDPFETKRALARRLGADRAVDPAGGDVTDRLGDLAPRGFDVVLECVGRPATAAQALGLARRGGTVIWFGVNPPGATVPVEPYMIYRNELTIRAAFVNPHTFARAVTLLAQRRIQAEPLLSHRFPLGGVAEGIAMMKTGQAVKALVLPNGA
jgi:2-desacetyl-2-hydroxyethyl bacteriochlorophyllide A dehydrogenase